MKLTLSLSLSDRKYKIASIIAALLYFFSSSVIPVLAAVSYSYDANENMSSDGTNCFTYNDENQLTQVTNCGSGKMVAAYVYNYQGNRIAKKSYDANGNLTKTTYTPSKSFETVKLASNSATQNTTYYYANDKLTARKNPDNSKTYVLSDNLNSISVLTDQNGNVLEKTSYYPFGATRTGGTQSKKLYTGQIKDTETGLDYYNARYYNSHIARFTQPDTVVGDIYNPQNLNRYSYVNNNPLRYTDPSGHCIGPLVAVCAAVISNPIGLALFGVAVIGTYAFVPSVRNAVNNGVSTLFTALYKGAATTTSTLFASRTTSASPQKGASGFSENGNSSPKGPNMSPLDKIAPILPLIPKNKDENVFSGFATVNQALNSGETWLGNAYREVDSGVYRSTDNLRQFRITSIYDNLPHVNFESFDVLGKRLENGHVYLLDMINLIHK